MIGMFLLGMFAGFLFFVLVSALITIALLRHPEIIGRRIVRMMFAAQTRNMAKNVTE